MHYRVGLKEIALQSQVLDSTLYREGMSRYAGHVQIVTTEWDGLRRGVTITAACSVSDNPATVLVCLNNGNANNDVLFTSGHFALNTLSVRHQELANAFAGFKGMTSEERFALAEWQVAVTGSPLLSDALVAFDCRVVDQKVTNTHTILFGAVEAVHFGPKEPALIYLDRSYHAL
ncbi:flavin reductase [Rhizobium sp. AAP43]|uniref:flavin reductase n=1 Tax=Rhizobium sp. AAP43 TaxID=1523420 RepID=UPI0006B9A2DE|nr:flavin reductase [Rhizobium sp. AAP43]KPF44200.1 4-hydroxyphenylacetate 3-monooxygenase [Rhizobium sp. AAP43]